MFDLKKVKIDVKLPTTMILLVAVTAITLTIVSLVMARSIITTATQTKLESVATLSAARMSTLIEEVDRDLRLTSQSPDVVRALGEFTQSYAALGASVGETLRQAYITDNPHPLGEKDALVEAGTGSRYDAVHAAFHPALDRLQNAMDYYDVFLFDPDGNLVYSVFKENDYATNMLTGPWKDSGLAQAFRQAVSKAQTDPSAYVDFAPYEPSSFAPAAFMSRPVFDLEGQLLGVLAYQMPIDQFNAAASDINGLGKTVDGFVVGPDRLMRTDSLRSADNDILETTVDTPKITDGLAGNAGGFSGTGHDGQDVMGHYVPINFGASHWVYVLQQDKSELFAVLNKAMWTIALISLVILGLAAFCSVLLCNSIVDPLAKLIRAVVAIADGALNTKVPGQDRGDGFGALARGTEVFRQNAIKMEALNDEQAKAAEEMKILHDEATQAAKRESELTREREAADEAAKAERAQMMKNLGESIGTVVNQAKAGDFSSRIEADFADYELKALSANVNALMDSVEAGLNAAGQSMSRIARGDLTRNMEGDFEGAFKELQDNTNDMMKSLKKLIGGITGSTDTLATSSSQLRSTSTALSQQAEQNAASLEETSAALEELSASIKQVDHNVSNASSNARVASDTARAGSAVASEAAEAISRINEASSEISKVVGIINDISFQINLLALNAGVEAARAGEAGRGFSVVASEVRQLAQRASEASNDIAQVISRSDEAVSDGVAKVKDAEVSLQQITTSVVGLSDSMEEIARAMSEQVGGVADINAAVAKIDQNTQMQVSSFEEVTAASALLMGEAEGLKQASSHFKTDTNVVGMGQITPAANAA